MVSMIRRTLPILLLAVISTQAASYKCAAVWDGDKKISNGCVTIQGDKIQSVGTCPAGAIDMSKYTAIPGMIDVHMHPTYVMTNPVSQPVRGSAVVYPPADHAITTL